MIDASSVKRMQKKKVDELHMQLCAKIEQAIIIAAMDSFTALMAVKYNLHKPDFTEYGLKSEQECKK